MRTGCFDAVVSFTPADKDKPLDALLLIRGTKIHASFYLYNQVQKEELNLFFVRVHTGKSLLLKWKDKFKVQEQKKLSILGEGCVLNPFSEKISQKKIKKRVVFLQRLLGDKKEMLFALVQEKGIQGIWEREVFNFSSLTKKSLLHLTQELEAEGKVRILSFTPILLLSQESLVFLCQKILTFLSHFHERHPEQTGVSLERIKRRFDLHSRILSLALKHLVRAGQIKEVGNEVALSSYEAALTSEGENILREMEDMCFKGEFRSISLEDLRERFHLSVKTLNRMLSLLIERKKIVQGKDGFLLHSRWLDEIVWRIKKSGKRELTVSDFKKMTGLTRKYAIPLLELLDQMGVTRRKGPSREIL